jgi:hypothetical protein
MNLDIKDNKVILRFLDLLGLFLRIKKFSHNHNRIILQYLSINRKKIGRLSRIRPNGRIKTL